MLYVWGIKMQHKNKMITEVPLADVMTAQEGNQSLEDQHRSVKKNKFLFLGIFSLFHNGLLIFTKYASSKEVIHIFVEYVEGSRQAVR